MKKKKSFIKICTLVFALLMLSACGKTVAIKSNDEFIKDPDDFPRDEKGYPLDNKVWIDGKEYDLKDATGNRTKPGNIQLKLSKRKNTDVLEMVIAAGGSFNIWRIDDKNIDNIVYYKYKEFDIKHPMEGASNAIEIFKIKIPDDGKIQFKSTGKDMRYQHFKDMEFFDKLSLDIHESLLSKS